MAFKRKFLEFQRFLENICSFLIQKEVEVGSEREGEDWKRSEAKKLQFDLHKDPAIP